MSDKIRICKSCHGDGAKGECWRCGGSGRLKTCKRAGCAEYGCEGAGDCAVPMPQEYERKLDAKDDEITRLRQLTEEMRIALEVLKERADYYSGNEYPCGASEKIPHKTNLNFIIEILEDAPLPTPPEAT